MNSHSSPGERIGYATSQRSQYVEKLHLDYQMHIYVLQILCNAAILGVLMLGKLLQVALLGRIRSAERAVSIPVTIASR